MTALTVTTQLQAIAPGSSPTQPKIQGPCGPKLHTALEKLAAFGILEEVDLRINRITLVNGAAYFFYRSSDVDDDCDLLLFVNGAIAALSALNGSDPRNGEPMVVNPWQYMKRSNEDDED